MSTTARRSVGFPLAIGALGLMILASVAWGSNPIPLAEVAELIRHPSAPPAGQADPVHWMIIHEQRIPRTLLLLLVGAALGVAGALMQSLTRNPLADPGILGVNAGAAVAVVTAVAVVGVTSIWFYLWFAFAGAAVASVAVYVLGGVGRRASGGVHGPTPARLALAGVAISMAISAVVQLVILTNQHAFNEFRFWAAGSAEGRGMGIVAAIAGFILAGLLLALLSAPTLNALALGDDAGRALGVRITRTRALVMLAVTLLAGAATAAVGPIMFVGLGVPYIARAVCGPDQRWVIPFCILAAPVVMLGADVAARLVIAPQEIQVGIMTALLGGPVFIALVRRPRLEALS